MTIKLIKVRTNRLLSVLLLFFCFVCIKAEVIRVNGSIVDDKGHPVFGVAITVEGQKIPPLQSDEDGKFVVSVFSDAKLSFFMVGYERLSVKVNGKTELKVVMKAKDLTLGPAVVRAKRIVKEVKPEQTVIEVHGNYLVITDPIRIPKELFLGKSRMVIQPVLSDITDNKEFLMPPHVFDGLEYNMTQERMYGYDLRRDSLLPYIRVNNSDTIIYKSPTGKKLGYLVNYKDSIYVKNGKHDFSCDMQYALEDYLRIYYGDTTTVAQGTVNPLRFMDYHFGSTVVKDTNYLPKLEVQLREGEGKINLKFPVGVSTLDINDSINGSEIRRLQSQLKAADDGLGQSLKDFKLMGLASPDGSYEKNLTLARERMKYSLNLILSNLSDATRKKMKVSSDAKVATWNDLANLLIKDSLKKEAQDILGIARKYRNSEKNLNAAIRNLSCYETLQSKYLPMLRTASYSFSYNLYRQLTMDEIKELYNKDYKKLSRYEFWKLYSVEKDKTLRRNYLKQALEVYPRFMVAANDYAALKISDNESDPNILLNFAGEKAPSEVNMNQAIALLDVGRYFEADTLMDYVPKNEDTKMLHAVIGIFNGNYNNDNYNTIAKTGLKNEVLMLLAQKKNNAALNKSMQLPDSLAMTHYLRATCYNRVEKINEAIDELNIAFKKDPNLKKVAKVDGDINKLLPPEDQLKPKAKN